MEKRLPCLHRGISHPQHRDLPSRAHYIHWLCGSGSHRRQSPKRADDHTKKRLHEKRCRVPGEKKSTSPVAQSLMMGLQCCVIFLELSLPSRSHKKSHAIVNPANTTHHTPHDFTPTLTCAHDRITNTQSTSISNSISRHASSLRSSASNRVRGTVHISSVYFCLGRTLEKRIAV